MAFLAFKGQIFFTEIFLFVNVGLCVNFIILLPLVFELWRRSKIAPKAQWGLGKKNSHSWEMLVARLTVGVPLVCILHVLAQVYPQPVLRMEPALFAHLAPLSVG